MFLSFCISAIATFVFGCLSLAVTVLATAAIFSQETGTSSDDRSSEVERTGERVAVVSSEVPVGIKAAWRRQEFIGHESRG